MAKYTLWIAFEAMDAQKKILIRFNPLFLQCTVTDSIVCLDHPNKCGGTRWKWSNMLPILDGCELYVGFLPSFSAPLHSVNSLMGCLDFIRKLHIPLRDKFYLCQFWHEAAPAESGPAAHKKEIKKLERQWKHAVLLMINTHSGFG